MNTLAHIFLSGNNEALMVGNFIADFVKGKKAFAHYPAPIQSGIILHRQIDAFTDAHPSVRRAAEHLTERHGRYAPVLIDVYFDYLLINNWLRYTEVPFEAFAAATYRKLAANMTWMPAPLASRLPTMMENNWLAQYGTWEGLDFAFTKMQARSKFSVSMAGASADLKEHFEVFDSFFLEFFPSLQAFVALKLSSSL